MSINAGFASADVAEVGPTVLVNGQGDFAAHAAFAATIADDIWNRRFEVLNDYLSVDETAAIAATYAPEKGPLVIADYADNPGAGGYGDSTELLRALLAADVSNACFAPMVDGVVVQALQSVVVGKPVQITLGGRTDSDFGGGPLAVEAELVSLSDGHFTGDGPMIHGLHGSFGPSAVIRVSGIEILVVTIPRQILVCDSGALCTPRYDRLPYRNVPRPIFPLDQPES